jgi:hypothetical protein
MGEDAQQRIATVQRERLAQPHDLVELGVRESERQRFLGMLPTMRVGVQHTVRARYRSGGRHRLLRRFLVPALRLPFGPQPGRNVAPSKSALEVLSPNT